MTRTPPAATLADGLIRELDRALRTVAAGNVAQRDYPGEGVPDPGQDPDSRRHGAALMRVNHAGEVAAHQGVARKNSGHRRLQETCESCREPRIILQAAGHCKVAKALFLLGAPTPKSPI